VSVITHDFTATAKSVRPCAGIAGAARASIDDRLALPPRRHVVGVAVRNPQQNALSRAIDFVRSRECD
jgi:hypothetical protein